MTKGKRIFQNKLCHLQVLCIYFGVFPFFPPFFPSLFYSHGLGVQTSYTPNILFSFFSLTMPLIKWELAFLWANCSVVGYIVVETLCWYLKVRIIVWISLMLCLLRYKIFTQLDTYCPIDYCPNTRVILSLYRKDPYSKQSLKK